MKLRISCWAEDLPSHGSAGGIFGVLTVLHKEPGVKPTVLGQTETIAGTNSPDWTKTFTLDNYQLGGQEAHLVISLYRGNGTTTENTIGSTLFEVGQVLGHAGSLAKELKNGGGIVAVHIEQASDVAAGQLHLQLRAIKLKNMDGLGFALNTSDPFFELQRSRTTTKGKSIWDAVYRSTAISNNLNPIFPEFFIDLEDLLGSSAAASSTAANETQFRIAVYDWDKSDQPHRMIGACIVTVNDLMDHINDTALQDDASKMDVNKALSIKNGDEETGKLLVVKAEVTGLPTPTEPAQPPVVTAATPVTPVPPVVVVANAIVVQPGAPVVGQAPPPLPEVATTTTTTKDEPDIVLTTEHNDDSIEMIVPDNISDLGKLQPTFCNYIAGGCQLHVIVAIDATSSNGDPRQPSSLHYFCDTGMNHYERAMSAICTVLAQYDTDQKYPVYGFGAKQNGIVNHCFPFVTTSTATTATSAEVDGVDGILQAYRATFRSGIVMSSPRDFSHVIRTAGISARNNNTMGDGAQCYSILVVFTNGSPVDSASTLAALKEQDDAPISFIIIGVNNKEEELTGTKALVMDYSKDAGTRDNVCFVHYREGQDVEQMTEAALHNIPSQLESYFIRKEIYPVVKENTDDVAVLPYSPASDVHVPIVINDTTGQIEVTEDVKPPPPSETKPSSSPNKTLEGLKKMGKKIQSNKMVGKIKQKLDQKTINMAKGKIGKLIGNKFKF